MTTVYVDPLGTALPEGAGRGQGEGGGPLPGALEALNRLCDARYEVVVLADRPLPALAGLDGRVRYDASPFDAPRAVAPRHLDADRPWLIASDAGWTERERPSGMRTIRVGPRRPTGRRTATRFDMEARDLPAAVMEILVTDLMPQ